MEAPQVVVSVSATEMAANFQGVWSEEAVYVKGQWVAYEEGLWVCLQDAEEETPGEEPAYWRLIGSLPKEAE